ncbi:MULTISPECIES: acyltransferase [Pseudomonas]|uniref:Putative acyltransferase n=2 Tax=Pseudomonas syringae group TaxID=136849 RepID=A0A3M4IWU5_PSEVI|nr:MULTISPECIES: acyltransferase [Pseudomonas]KTB73988.1 hypothetical protein AO068_02855 [Pseudomonas sp. ICMP 3272]KTC53640.1 hypothetical protein AO258_02865 [Pseudomonas syringae ICMP 19498]RMP05946.1 putative acyltransferase [Pseudomonas syringae pv. persicae]RMQ09272.1 putative acyltransferase [Pseudomonas viridiflava]RMQ77551.1 putative acyltransferase [Pseudomonas viridiflava]
MDNKTFAVKKMSPSLSVYIDLLRVICAVSVMMEHYPFSSDIENFFTATNYAYDAVVVFFVLSGYVISYSADTFEKDRRDYAANRMARILPVAFTAVLLSAIFFLAVGDSRVDLYGDVSQKTNGVITFIQSITFTNQVWSSNEQPFANGPYWSLAFEVWCYVIYGVMFYCRGWTRVLLLLMLVVMLGPKQLIILPMWLAGSLAYHVRFKATLPRFVLYLLLLLPIAIYISVQATMPRDWSYVYAGRNVERILGFGLDGAANFGWGYLLAILMSLHLYAFQRLFNEVNVDLDILFSRLVRFLAGYTFTLYLFHVPIIKFILAVTGLDKTDLLGGYGAVVYGAVFVAVYFIGNVVEHKKVLFRGWAHFVIGRFSQALQRTSRS